MASYIINLDSRDLRAALNSVIESDRETAKTVLKDIKDRLAQLHEHRNRITYAHLELLDLYGQDNAYIENEFTGISEAITGTITSGSINLDGSSAMRRTCTLGVAIKDDIIFRDYYWTLNSKFQAWVGLENIINIDFINISNLNLYSDLVIEVTNPNQLLMGNNIIWLNQGQFVISSFSAQQTTNNWSVNLSGKDLMCQLNGEIGGTFVAEEVLNRYEDAYSNPGETIWTDLTLNETIRSIVHRFCPKVKIITNDLKQEKGRKLYKYVGDSTLYGLVQYDATLKQDTLKALTVFGDQPVYNKLGQLINIADCQENTIILLQGQEYEVRKVNYGEQIGYQEVEYYFAEDLKVSPGDNAVTALDKIKSAFAGFEYFFDLNGDFIFRKKRGYIELAATNEEIDNTEIEYTFEDASLLTSMSITPSLTDFKNDFVVWGTKKSSNGIESDLLMHYAFDTKPIEYIAFDKGFTQSEMFRDYNKIYWNLFDEDIQEWKTLCWDGDWTGENGEGIVISLNSQNFDWRELLYRMALDDNTLNSWEALIQADQQKDTSILDYNTYLKCLNIITAWKQEIAPYRPYFPELRAFWRNLYNPEVPMEYKEVNNTYEIQENESLWGQPLIKLSEKPENFDRDNFFVEYNSDLFLWTDTRDLTLYEDLYTIKNDTEYQSFYATIVLPSRKSPTNIYIKNNKNDQISNIVVWTLDQLKKNISYSPTLFALLEATYVSNNNNLNDTLNGALLRNCELTENTTWDQLSQYPIVYIKETNGTYVRCRLAEDFCDVNGVAFQQADIITAYFNHNLYYKTAVGGKEPLFQIETGNKAIFYKAPNLEIISDEHKDKYNILSFGVKLSELESIAETNNGIKYTIDWWDSEEQNKTKELYPAGVKPLLFCLIDYLGNTLHYNQLYTWANNTYQHILTPYTKTLHTTDIYIQETVDNTTTYYSLYQKLYDEMLSNELPTQGNVQYYCYSLVKMPIESNQENIEIDNNITDTELLLKKAYRIIQSTNIEGWDSREYYYKYYQYYVYTSDYKHNGSILEKYFSKAYNQDRTSANYWLEFIDPTEINNEAQKQHWERLLPSRAGRRTKISDEKSVSLLWTPQSEQLNLGDITPPTNSLIAVSTIGKTAYNAINELLYNHSYATESISLTTIPLYFIQPNTIIHIGNSIRGHNDIEQGVIVSGDYILSKLSIPLTYNGTSSLTLSRKPDWFDVAWADITIANNTFYTTLGEVTNQIWYLTDKVKVIDSTLIIQ